MDKKAKIIKRLKELSKPICTYCLALELGYKEQPDINSTVLELVKMKIISREKGLAKCCGSKKKYLIQIKNK